VYSQSTNTSNGVKHFSVSKSTSRQANHHALFDTKAGDFAHMVQIAMTYPWSPVVFKPGTRRRKENFLSSACVAIDIDKELTLLDAQKWLAGLGYQAAILLTKSHQKQKGDHPPCDRFRILIEAETVKDREQYEQNIQWWHKQLPMADKSCCDGGRFFWPSPVFAWAIEGQAYVWKDFSEEIKRQKKAIEKFRTDMVKKYQGCGDIGEKLRMKIKHGAAQGERHKMAYHLGASLATLGIDYHRSVQMICSGPLAEIGITEVEKCVREARKKVLG